MTLHYWDISNLSANDRPKEHSAPAPLPSKSLVIGLLLRRAAVAVVVEVVLEEEVFVLPRLAGSGMSSPEGLLDPPTSFTGMSCRERDVNHPTPQVVTVLVHLGGHSTGQLAAYWRKALSLSL